jgi:hypothetical protein
LTSCADPGADKDGRRSDAAECHPSGCCPAGTHSGHATGTQYGCPASGGALHRNPSGRCAPGTQDGAPTRDHSTRTHDGSAAAGSQPAGGHPARGCAAGGHPAGGHPAGGATCPRCATRCAGRTGPTSL